MIRQSNSEDLDGCCCEVILYWFSSEDNWPSSPQRKHLDLQTVDTKQTHLLRTALPKLHQHAGDWMVVQWTQDLRETVCASRHEWLWRMMMMIMIVHQTEWPVQSNVERPHASCPQSPVRASPVVCTGMPDRSSTVPVSWAHRWTHHETQPLDLMLGRLPALASLDQGNFLPLEELETCLVGHLARHWSQQLAP